MPDPELRLGDDRFVLLLTSIMCSQNALPALQHRIQTSLLCCLVQSLTNPNTAALLLYCNW